MAACVPIRSAATADAVDAITMTVPDDWHHHLRDGAFLEVTTQHCGRTFRRAICMPNIKPPITTTEQALAYRERILAATPEGANFEPMMTLYMTDSTTPEEVRKAKDTGVVAAIKLYPKGATTNSENGVTDIFKLDETLLAMQEVGMPLLLHGEVTDSEVDIFDREAVFIETIFKPLTAKFPGLKFVMEHITTKVGVDFVMSAPANVGGTITAHHLLYNRNHLLVGGIKPHYYCLPILKSEENRQALLAAVASGSPKLFLGTDSAPHLEADKCSACGCAGVFTAHAALEFYAEAFDQIGRLDLLEAFCSHNGADFYGLPRNEGTVTLRRTPQAVAKRFNYGDKGGFLVPLRAGGNVAWALETGSQGSGSGAAAADEPPSKKARAD